MSAMVQNKLYEPPRLPSTGGSSSTTTTSTPPCASVLPTMLTAMTRPVAASSRYCDLGQPLHNRLPPAQRPCPATPLQARESEREWGPTLVDSGWTESQLVRFTASRLRVAPAALLHAANASRWRRCRSTMLLIVWLSKPLLVLEVTLRPHHSRYLDYTSG